MMRSDSMTVLGEVDRPDEENGNKVTSHYVITSKRKILFYV